ncbi:protein containing Clp [mine drainage metagenome]|uniref:Protein containing Clp n=1 Tax=mine drainage metagenome TaxID=410659 RepID=T1AXZ2_9ZZZZ
MQQIIPTSRVKKVIEVAFEEAKRMNNTYVGTEHLLLGLLIEGEGIAAHVLEDMGANLGKVRTELDSQLNNHGVDDEALPEQEKTTKTPLLDQFCRDLTELAQKNRLDPVIGREMEIERVVQILSRRTKNNPA